MSRKDYRLTVKVTNNNILAAAADIGITSMPKLAAMAGISYPALNKLINLLVSPVCARSGAPTEMVVKLCAALKADFADLFSIEQCVALETNKSQRELSHKEMKLLAGAVEPVDHMRQLEIDSTFKALNLSRLSPRQREVIRLRYGFDGDALTLQQVAKKFGVSPGRIRQIESMAMNKMRHPASWPEGFNRWEEGV